jgi:hypothetical protein
MTQLQLDPQGVLEPNKQVVGVVTTQVRTAQPNDWLYIDGLRKREGDSLGFLPKALYASVLEQRPIANRKRWLYQRLIVTEDNGDLTGFCYWSIHGPLSRIIQIVVQEDARRLWRASLMTTWVESEARELGKKGVSCRVAADLDSNLFWAALGYSPIDRVTSTWLNQRRSYRGRELFIYLKPLAAGSLWLPQREMAVV